MRHNTLAADDVKFVPICPYCGSEETTYNGGEAYYARKSEELDIFLEFQCDDCGHKFYLEEE